LHPSAGEHSVSFITDNYRASARSICRLRGRVLDNVNPNFGGLIVSKPTAINPHANCSKRVLLSIMLTKRDEISAKLLISMQRDQHCDHR
jgi:hypothetical protein